MRNFKNNSIKTNPNTTLKWLKRPKLQVFFKNRNICKLKNLHVGICRCYRILNIMLKSSLISVVLCSIYDSCNVWIPDSPVDLIPVIFDWFIQGLPTLQ